MSFHSLFIVFLSSGILTKNKSSSYLFRSWVCDYAVMLLQRRPQTQSDVGGEAEDLPTLQDLVLCEINNFGCWPGRGYPQRVARCGRGGMKGLDCWDWWQQVGDGDGRCWHDRSGGDLKYHNQQEIYYHIGTNKRYILIIKYTIMSILVLRDQKLYEKKILN